MPETKIIRLATRGSALALWQADRVAESIIAARPEMRVEKVIVSTKPDRIQDKPLHELGGDKGLFVKEVENAVLDGRADAAVHSLKDVPVDEMTEGLELVAFPERADPRDVLISRSGKRLNELPPGSVVATGAPRRQAQLLNKRPDLKVCDVRGNVETRLRKLRDGEFDAIIMAAAGLNRLGMQNQITQKLSLSDFVPAPGQGIVAVQARDDSPWMELWRLIDNENVRMAAEMEREFSRLIGATCHTAAGCLMRPLGADARFRAAVYSLDGEKVLWYMGDEDIFNARDMVVEAAEYFLREGCREFM